jgi:hypothetical protein
MLLSVHALACLARGSNRIEHLAQAREWLPKLEDSLKSMREDIEYMMQHEDERDD